MGDLFKKTLTVLLGGVLGLVAGGILGSLVAIVIYFVGGGIRGQFGSAGLGTTVSLGIGFGTTVGALIGACGAGVAIFARAKKVV